MSAYTIARCFECGQELPKPQTHVYAVKVRVGSGAMKWLFSEPTDEQTALREAIELRATGHTVEVLRKYEVEEKKAALAAKKGRRRNGSK